MVTIQEVAKEAQVSVGSVSRYLNGYKLKEQNMLRIKQAIETLDYKENLFAKGLKNNQTLSIGILMNNMQSVFSSTLIAQIEEEMESHNYSILLNSYRNKVDKVAGKIDFLLDRKVDGLIIFEAEPEWPVFERLQDIEIPVISVNTTLDYPQVDSIIVNNRESAKKMVLKIIDSGHDQIGVISVPKNYSVAKDRLNGALDAFFEKGLKNSDYQVFYGDYSQKSGYKGAEVLIGNGVTTIFVTNYNMALGSLQYMFEKGIKLGEEISFACFDYPGVNDIFYPRLTTVRQPVHKMGTVTVERMFERIMNPTIKSEIIQLENEIHWGNSIKEWK